MIKVYCDKCGKEITGNINKEIEEIEAIDINGDVVTRFTKTFHCCDECQYNDLTCGFKVGDQVITSTGQIGTITDICTCDKCKERGFYEPTVDVEIGSGSIRITDNDKRVNFRSFYKIGDRVFGNLDEECVVYDINRRQKEISDMRKELIELEVQLGVINKLQNNESYLNG